MQLAPDATDDENSVGAFTGRVLAALASLIVLGLLSAAMVAIAYYSKFELRPAGSPPPPPAGASATLP